MIFFFAAQQAFLDKAIYNSFRFILYKQTWTVFVQRELIRHVFWSSGTKGVHQSVIQVWAKVYLKNLVSSTSFWFENYAHIFPPTFWTLVISRENDGFLLLISYTCLSLCAYFDYRFVNALVYYGVFLSAPSIGGNMYLNFFLASIVELPAIPGGIWIYNR